jgi:hypothetical protein
MAQIRLWVDDLGSPPPDLNVHAKTFAGAVKYLESGKVVAISLDHDLGEKKTGCDIARWIAKRKLSMGSSQESHGRFMLQTRLCCSDCSSSQ